jgi:phage-related protein
MEEANGCRRSFWRKPMDVEETIRRCRGRKIRQLEEVGGGFWED